MASQFKLPDLGENIDSAQVVSVLVSPGDSIEAEQAVIEVETDKAVMEVPSDSAGRVSELLVNEGDTVQVGQPILTLEAGGDGKAESAEEAKPEAEPAEEKKQEQAPEQPAAQQAQAQQASEAAAKVEPAKATGLPWQEEEQESAEPEQPAPSAPVTDAAETPSRTPVFAAPSVRQFAREVGVDITQVEGSGPGGRISVEDVKRHAREHPAGAPAAPGAAPAAPLPDFTRWGEVEREAMSNVRKKTAQHMATGWVAPHVTLHDKADVTDIEALRKRFQKRAEAAGGKLTITAILLKIVAAALKKHPQINCSIDMAKQEIVYKRFIHVGVAADTKRGLVVPVIRDVDQKNIIELSVELTEMAEKARSGKLSLDDMSGGTFTLTNLGGIGIGHFTPIINSPEVAILGVGRAHREPVWDDQTQSFEPRLMMPLSLSFDHRIVDGADGARFLRWMVEAIEQPLLIALEG